MFHFCIFNHNQDSIERDRSQLTWSQRPFNSRGRPVLPLQELEQLPGFCSPHHTQDRAIEKALREKGGFIDGKSSPNLYRHRRIQSSIRYGVVSLSNDEVVSQWQIWDRRVG